LCIFTKTLTNRRPFVTIIFQTADPHDIADALDMLLLPLFCLMRGRDQAPMTVEEKLGSVIHKRRSIRRYQSAQIGPAVIERLLRAAAQAPSAHNRQPWRFVVLDDIAAKRTLATAMGQRLRVDRTADGDDPKSIEADVSRSYSRITEAPVVILVCMDIRDMDEYQDERRRQAEYLMAVQSTAMATQNLLLAAEQEGLGACVMCAPLFCPEVVAEASELPTGWKAQMLVTVGHPDNTGKHRPRRPLSDIIIWSPKNQAAS
jgi:coenzyme F420-0:L-glutamate ligase / coenzyme F420-1:gamma-L-glutamate ligase